MITLLKALYGIKAFLEYLEMWIINFKIEISIAFILHLQSDYWLMQPTNLSGYGECPDG